MQTDWLTDTAQVIGKKVKKCFCDFFPVGESCYYWHNNIHVTNKANTYKSRARLLIQSPLIRIKQSEKIRIDFKVKSQSKKS